VRGYEHNIPLKISEPSNPGNKTTRAEFFTTLLKMNKKNYIVILGAYASTKRHPSCSTDGIPFGTRPGFSYYGTGYFADR
jgi:hypothetical protein